MPPRLLGEDECFPYYEYSLRLVDNEDVELKWIHWKKLVALKEHDVTVKERSSKIESPDTFGNFYCTVNEYYLETLYVPTYLSTISVILKEALLFNMESKQSRLACLAFIGGSGVGKSSLLYMLANSMNEKQWKGIIDDRAPVEVNHAIQNAKEVYRRYLLENDLPFMGAFFIDDVNLDESTATEVEKCGAELYRSLLGDNFNHYYDSERRKWLQLDKLLLAIGATLNGKSLYQRFFRHCIAFSIPESGESLSDVFCTKFIKMCPYVREDIAFDIANITLKLFNQFRYATLNECVISPMISSCPASRQVQHVFSGISKAFEKFPVVSSLQVCKQWKRLVATVTSGSIVEKPFVDMLDGLINNTAQHKSNIKGVIFKDATEGGKRKSAMSSGTGLKTTSVGSGRPSFRPSLYNMQVIKDKSNEDQVEGSELKENQVYNSYILMSPEEIKSMSLPDVEQIYFENFLTVDFENPLFWKDIQKCIKFLIVGDSPYSLFWGPAKPVLSIVLRSACFIAKWNCIPFTLREGRSLKEFLLHYVNTFCYFLLVAHEEDLKCNSRFVDVVRRNREKVRSEDGGIILTESMLKLWHIHLNDISTDIDSSFWSEFFDIYMFHSPEIHQLLQNEYDISFKRNPNLQKYFLQFLSHTKVVFSFGPNSDEIQAVKELTRVPKLSDKMQNIHFSAAYRMNTSVVFNAVQDYNMADKLSNSVVSVVSDVASHDVFDSSFFLEEVQNFHYTEGTYEMICHLYQLSVDPSTSDNWDLYADEFDRIMSLTNEGKETVHAHTDPSSENDNNDIDDIDDDDDDKGDTFDTFADISDSVVNMKLKLSDIVWACVSARYLTMCESPLRDELERAILDDMENFEISPKHKDIRRVAYAYFHTLIHSSRVSVSDEFITFFDTVLLCGDSVLGLKTELCFLLMTLLFEGAVRIIGSSHFVVRLLADLAGVKVADDVFKIRHCDNYDLEEIMSVSEDRTKVTCCDDKTRNSTHIFSQSIIGLPSSKTPTGNHASESITISQRTSVLIFDLQNTVTVDCFIIYFLMKGFTSRQLLFDSFAYFHQLSKSLNSSTLPSSTDHRRIALEKVADDSLLITKHSITLDNQWKDCANAITKGCQGFAALCSSASILCPSAYESMSWQLLQFVNNLTFTQKASPMEDTVRELLNYFYGVLLESLNECTLLALKMNIVITISEANHRVCNSLLRQLLSMLQKRQGLLGLHSSASHNDDIIPTDASFDIMNMTFQYLNTINNSISRERLGPSDLKNMFLEYSDTFEEWANMYYVDLELPVLTNELRKLTYFERLVIIAVLKPIALNIFVSDGIFDLTCWSVSDCETKKKLSLVGESTNKREKCLEKESNVEECEPVALITLYDNPTGCFDSFSESREVIPLLLSDVLLKSTDGEHSAARTLLDQYVINSPGSDSAKSFLQYIAKTIASHGNNCVVESKSFLAETPTSSNVATRYAANIIVKGVKPPNVIWSNFSILLKITLESLLKFHFEHMSNVGAAMQLAIPKLLARCYWLLALYHVAVLIRLQYFSMTMGDDILKHAARLLMRMRVRSVHEPELHFSKMNKLVYQVFHQVYDTVSDSSYAKGIVLSLFENIFTEYATDPDMEYFLLGLLQLPATFDVRAICDFVDDIDAVLGGGEGIHIADFIGCTNGELYESELRALTSTVLQTPAGLKSSLISHPRLYSDHHRLIPVITYMLEELPHPIKVNADNDNVTLKKLCAAQDGLKKQSIASALIDNDWNQQSSRRAVAHKNINDNHLWFYLQLEIESFNSSLESLKEILSAMLECQSCPMYIFRYVEDLVQGFVPHCWLKCSFDETNIQRVSLKLWIKQLILRRKMLNVWFSQRYPEYVYLHLLHNPEGFVYALKQSFAVGQNKSLEEVNIDARILKLPYTSLERHNEISKINMGNMKNGIQAFSIVVAGAHMMNARWLEENYNLEFLNPSFAAKFSQELYIKISATCEDCFDDEDFQCPVFTSPDFPTSDTIRDCSRSSSKVLWPALREPLFHVAIPSQCPIVEWRKRSVTIHASPDWHIPEI